MPPLALPDLQRLPPSAELARQPRRSALFVDRARAADTDFALTAANAAAVAAICHRLDGLPLAIELAAARVQLLPPPALLARLSAPAAPDRRTARPAGPPADDARRHRLELRPLLPAEQALFRRLAVFVGGFTLEAAEAIGQGTGTGEQGSGQPPGIEFLNGIASLVDKSLLRPGARGSRRAALRDTGDDPGVRTGATGHQR